jgi:hypothetical protein
MVGVRSEWKRFVFADIKDSDDAWTGSAPSLTGLFRFYGRAGARQRSAFTSVESAIVAAREKIFNI